MLLVKDMPKSKHKDFDFIVDQLDWDANVDPKFKDHHYLEPVPVADTRKEGFVDRWIVYGKIDGATALHRQGTDRRIPAPHAPSRTTALTASSASRAAARSTASRSTARSSSASHELTEDEYFCTEDGAKAGVTFENTSETEPLVCLRYFGPEVNPDAPAMGAYRKNKF